jgi:hypothetical protein
MHYVPAILALAAVSASAMPATIEKRSNSATTHNPAAPGQTFCDVSFGDAYYVHVGEPWDGGAGCDNIYNGLKNSEDGSTYITGWSCQADGSPQSEGWQPTYLGFNAPAGKQEEVSDRLGYVFGISFHCSY